MISETEQASAYAARYERRARWWRARPLALRGLVLANRMLVYGFYLAYGALLAAAAATAPLSLVPLAFVPAAGFVLLSVVRARLDAPRPRERDGIDPLVPREGTGRSFPSRHAFSAFAIAASWWAMSPPVAVALLVLACGLAVVRVIGGVHYPRDVAAGAAVGLAVGLTASAGALLGF